ncbi:hypothetical protein AB0L74_10210 [Streptomyces sp. NPDC052020]|uniref:hypothetical protein n=1 Tax=Streptomyces sp. NPDC052020 TaxID=3155677 RepID=UPI003431F58B
MAVGMIPEGLVNIGVILAWTPGERDYTVTLIDREVQRIKGQQYPSVATEVIGYEPPASDLDVKVYHALTRRSPLVARIAQTLAGSGYLQWLYPAAMSSKARARYEEAAR